LGATIKPFPKDPIDKNLTIRPEARYSISDSRAFFERGGDGNFRTFKDQLTIGADIIFSF